MRAILSSGKVLCVPEASPAAEARGVPVRLPGPRFISITWAKDRRRFELELGAQFEDRDGDYEEDDGDDEPGHGDASDEDPVNAGAGGVVEPCPLGVRVHPLCMCSLLNQDIKQ